MTSEDLNIDPIQYSNTYQKQIRDNLINTSDKQSLFESDDPLINTITKRRSDAIKITNYMVRQRLTNDLDDIIKGHFKQHPEMKEKAYVAVIQGDTLSAEVVSLEKAIEAVADKTQEEARELMTSNQMGYFSAANFTMKTESEEEYQELKNKMDEFFTSNAKIFQYLRQNSDQIFDIEELQG